MANKNDCKEKAQVALEKRGKQESILWRICEVRRLRSYRYR